VGHFIFKTKVSNLGLKPKTKKRFQTEVKPKPKVTLSVGFKQRFQTILTAKTKV